MTRDPAPSRSPVPLVKLRHVSVRRGGRLALHDVTLRIAEGEHVAISSTCLPKTSCGR